jgi:predicted extracellular nuclease
VPIWAIQGTGDRSPYVSRNVTTEGIVIGAFPEMGGFWIQEIETDADPATSAGVYAFMPDFDVPVVIGDLVRLDGKVREISGQTTLAVDSAESMTILSSDNPLPAPALYDPPRETDAALGYKEALEGMLVTLDGDARVVAPTTKYGEFVVLDTRWDQDSVRRTDETGHLIFVDDGSEVEHLDQSTQVVAVAKGDIISGLTGPLAYTFDNYKIEPIDAPTVTSGMRELPTLEPLADNQFSIVTFNVENLFDTVDPHPSSPEQLTPAQYAIRLEKAADAIVRMGAPTIIGLQEVENIDVLQDIAAQDALADFGYEAMLIEGSDARGIDVGYLVRGDQATVESVESFPAPEGVTTRHPLLMQVTVNVGDTPQTVYLLNNHFTSLSAGEEATEPRRTAQAAWNVEIMNQVRDSDPEAQFVVMGDLNSFVETLPLNTLTDGGLVHVYDFFADSAEIPYTYIFQGATQSLDHILVSPSLFDQMTLVTTLPINADYPLPFPDDVTAQRLSDHDPLIAIFTVE